MAADIDNETRTMDEHNHNELEGAGRHPNPRFLQHIRFPAHTQHLSRCDGSATGIGSCGDRVTIRIAVDRECIRAIFQNPVGCLFTTACASAVSVLAQSRTLEKALEIQPEDVETELGGLPEDHRHCARLAVNTLGEAIADYYRQALTNREKEIPPQTKGNPHAHL